jgi:hypothetical protein
MTMPNPAAEVVAYLREEADFNRSWTDGRRGPPFGADAGYIARRKELANQRDNWANEIERLSRERDTALAIERDPTSSERVCALMDAQYMAGAKAGWNASQSEDPEAAYAALGKSRDGYVKVLIETRSPAVSRERDTGVPEGWRSPGDLPELKDGERFAAYLAFDTGEVKLADWTAWTDYGSEYHGSTGVYLGQYAQDGDALYMTDDGFEVRKDSDERWFAEKHFDDGTKTPFYVTGWIEALKPIPAPPGSAAPQPPSVSDQAGEIERWQHIAKQGLAKCTPEHTWAEWVADRNAENDRLSAELVEARKELEPFATFAANVDENGWTSNIHREQISTWFGPSDFRRARAALSPKKDTDTPETGDST